MGDLRARAERLLREPVGSPIWRSRSTRRPPRRRMSTSAAGTSSRRSSRTSARPRRRSTSTSSGSGRARSASEFATALLAKAAEGVPVRLVVDSAGSRPDGSSREFYERLLAGGVEVRVVRATRRWARLNRPRPAAASLEPRPARARRPSEVRRGRRPHRLGRRRRCRGPLRRRPLPRPLRARHRARWSRSCSSSSSRRSAGSAGRSRSTSSTRSFPPTRTSPARSRPPCCTTRRAATARSRRPSRDLLDGARETLDVVNPYVSRPSDDPADRGRRPARRASAAVRARPSRTTSPAPPRSGSITRRCSTPACASSSTRRCCTRRRSCATARTSSPAPATSRRGASSASSRSTCSCARRALATQFDERFSRAGRGGVEPRSGAHRGPQRALGRGVRGDLAAALRVRASRS